jgi:hypothetical protein
MPTRNRMIRIIRFIRFIRFIRTKFTLESGFALERWPPRSPRRLSSPPAVVAGAQ